MSELTAWIDGFETGFACGVLLVILTWLACDAIEAWYLRWFRRKYGFDPRVDKDTFDLIAEAKIRERIARKQR